MSTWIVRSRSGRDLAWGVETLVGDGVPALVVGLVNEILSIELAPDVLDGAMMGRI